MRKIAFSILLVINLALFAWSAWNIVDANGNFRALIYISILIIQVMNIAWVLANLASLKPGV